MRRNRRIAAIVLPLLIGLVACTGSGGNGSSASSSTGAASRTTAESTTGRTEPSARGSGAAEPTDSSAFPADTSADGGPAQAGATADPTGQMHVTALRLGEHPGYARLVIDLNTAGVPRWMVRYTEKSGPGGGPVTIAGDVFLRVSLTTGADPGLQTPSSDTGSGLIAQARTTGFFEGDEEVLLGIRDARRPFRAFALTDPGRIVIDVRRP
jgi:hypothetical protein